MVTFHQQTQTLRMYLYVSVMTGTATRLVQKGDFLHFKTTTAASQKGRQWSDRAEQISLHITSNFKNQYIPIRKQRHMTARLKCQLSADYKYIQQNR